MRFRLVCTTLLALPLVTALAAPAPQQQKTALVTVVAEAGGPVAGLTAKDFVVREDKATREVVAAERSAEPLFITLLVDSTQPPMGILPPTQDLRRALSSFVSTIKGASPDAQIAIMEFAGASVTAVDFTAEAHGARQVHPAPVPQSAERRRPDRSDGRCGQEAQRQALSTPRDRVDRLQLARHERRKDDEAGGGERPQGRRHRVGSLDPRTCPARPVRARKCLNVVTRASGGMRLTAVEATGLEAMLKSVANSPRSTP